MLGMARGFAGSQNVNCEEPTDRIAGYDAEWHHTSKVLAHGQA